MRLLGRPDAPTETDRLYTITEQPAANYSRPAQLSGPTGRWACPPIQAVDFQADTRPPSDADIPSALPRTGHSARPHRPLSYKSFIHKALDGRTFCLPRAGRLSGDTHPDKNTRLFRGGVVRVSACAGRLNLMFGATPGLPAKHLSRCPMWCAGGRGPRRGAEYVSVVCRTPSA